MSRVRDFPDGKTTWLRFRSIAEAAATMQKVEDNVYMPHATHVPQPSAGRVGELRGRRHNLTIAVPVHLLLASRLEMLDLAALIRDIGELAHVKLFYLSIASIGHHSSH
jgi:hypothetical protein